MILTHIKVANLAGLPAFDQPLPGVAVISGKNGAGKSSLNRILLYAMGRRPLAEKGSRSVQHDPSILRGGAESGEAVLTFSEDSPAEFLRVRVREDSTERKVKMRGRKAWEDASSFIDDITSALAYDPMKFSDLEPKERVEVFLRAMKVSIEPAEITVAVGGAIPLGAMDRPGLDTINSIYDDIYKARTRENGDADRMSKHAAQLEEALPPAATDDWTSEASRIRVELESVKSEGNSRATAIARSFTAAELDLQKACTRECADIAADINARILALKQEQQVRHDEAVRAMDVKVSAARAEAERSRQAVVAEVSPKITDLTTRLATAEERARAEEQAKGTRRAAEEARQQAETSRARSKEMTAALERLTALKSEIGSRFKIGNVTIAAPRAGLPVDLCRPEGGGLVPFSIWNDSDKDQFCLKIALRERGPLGLVCVDNLGNFSPKRREAVIATCRKYAHDSGMQFLVGFANDDGELKIEDAGGAA